MRFPRPALLLPLCAAAACLDDSAAMTQANGPTTAEIFDRSVQASPYASVETIADPAYRAFVGGVLAATGASARPAGDGRPADLRILRSPLVSSGNDPGAPPPRPATPPGGGCRISTPWFALLVAPGARAAKGTFLWNERRVLRDRAAMAGVVAPSGPAPGPLPADQFERLAQAYAETELQGARRPSGAKATPAEIRWLFTQAPPNTFLPFSQSALDAMRDVGVRAADFYARLAGVLIERCRRDGEDITIDDVGVALRFTPHARP